MTKHIIRCLVCLTLLGCQPSRETAVSFPKLSSDDGILDLSQYTEEQQKTERAQAVKEMELARKSRIITIPLIEQSDNNESIEINVAVFARTFENTIGKRVFQRIANKKLLKNQCLRFKDKASAQRYFLFKGGPAKDNWNLDPDGDGFACDWDPTIYRDITVP